MTWERIGTVSPPPRYRWICAECAEAEVARLHEAPPGPEERAAAIVDDESDMYRGYEERAGMLRANIAAAIREAVVAETEACALLVEGFPGSGRRPHPDLQDDLGDVLRQRAARRAKGATP